jgi:adenylosuccinate synthase
LVVVGAQWGDEGKGKIVDWLATRADVVARFQGGNNAGHTLVVDGEQTVLHLVPAGVLRPGTLNLIGPGVVVDPGVLIQELEKLVARGILQDPARVRVSGRAHVILGWNIALDKAREESRKGSAIGTTGRGIGPTYEDKVARRGVRVADLLDPASLRETVDRLAREKNFELTEVHHWTPVDADEIYEAACEYGRKLAPYVDHTGRLLVRALGEGKNVLFEGAQGTFLDVDHGTYPFVTSSTCLSGYAAPSCGLPARFLDGVIGVFKAYSTRVGSGPFPTELFEGDAVGDLLVDRGREFGTNTGRKRRAGWLDLVMLKHATRLNTCTELAITKLDVLSPLPELKVCVAYEDEHGTRYDHVPYHQSVLHKVRPIYETLPGWQVDVERAERIEDLPDAARQYVRFIEQFTGVHVSFVSVGPARDQCVVLPRAA